MTIYALSSGPGTSGIAVIRISGTETLSVIKKLTSRDIPEPRVATLRKINYINTSELIDEAIILWFPGPESYTGDDLAEIHVHGSHAVIQAVLKSISQIKDCRLAEPGEFTKIAFLNGKINLLQAESIGDLISSETEIQRKQAIKIMNGSSSKIFNQLREKLLKILSYVEAKIDFPDEDLPKNILKNIKTETKEIHDKIQKILKDNKVGEKIREGFKIVILGPTNAGKSSLLNLLSNREVSIVSETAGTTRDIIEAHLNIDGYPVIISDTAGIRDSKNEIEKKGIKLALNRAEEADLKLIVLDEKNHDFTSFFDNLVDDNCILIINKSDLIENKKVYNLGQLEHIFISIKNNSKIDELILKIKDKLKNKFITGDDILITRERHRQHLENCSHSLEDFFNKNQNKDFDKAAEDLRIATRELGKIVGKVDVEELLGSIFNDFCIGK
ncbi:tRNA uridine-5-carboxymethylaminomethyl(34) synthesis GTPase MnmE [Candidatus Pelagibacter sp.]|nr:tRNA uridine-5-carboxymethylaminomethyl(34) synthesis GTPase MnmE [Candidatus Pelagibacter sp.]